ncbi:MAG: DUF2293 domain-containing protein [Desulfobulbaceae bacterium]|nr:DUF2293 domain-containing protein [Desulfobulbaceae bacterium]
MVATKEKSRQNNRENALTVFITSSEAKCDECGASLGKGAWITMPANDKKAVCLNCADLEHLAFLPAGDTALSRRARKYSRLAAVVMKWSRARKHYERQGLLVEEEAIARAEGECAADSDQRERRRLQAMERRAELDQEYLSLFAARVRALYPACPADREQVIAAHACRKYSGRVGRSAAAKELDEVAVELAVTAHIRHRESNYDQLLLDGCERRQARGEVRGEIARVLAQWRGV